MKFDGIDHSSSPKNIQELIDFHKSNCNRYVNGECLTRKCLIRGGWNKTGSANPEAATCESRETVICLVKLTCLQKQTEKGE